MRPQPTGSRTDRQIEQDLAITVDRALAHLLEAETACRSAIRRDQLRTTRRGHIEAAISALHDAETALATARAVP